MYHGAGREKHSERQLAKYDLVITTYGTLSSEVKKGMTKDELAREGKAKMDDLKVISSILELTNQAFLGQKTQANFRINSSISCSNSTSLRKSATSKLFFVLKTSLNVIELLAQNFLKLFLKIIHNLIIH